MCDLDIRQRQGPRSGVTTVLRRRQQGIFIDQNGRGENLGKAQRWVGREIFRRPQHKAKHISLFSQLIDWLIAVIIFFFFSLGQLIDWLTAWWIFCVFDWLIDWLIASSIDWLIDCSIDWLVDWLVDFSLDFSKLVDWLIDCLIEECISILRV